MATTTPNFGWDIPQSTDLVKDGATAIAALGTDIDTALVDLKGGTTGQVLSKASNTDLDFSWVAQDDSNAIQNALLTTTGDTIYASSASTPARLGIGTTGQVLTVAGGVPSWATPSSGGMTLISTTTLTGATVTLSSIPSTYIHLQLVIRSFDPVNDGARMYMRFNADSTASRHATRTFFDSTTAATAFGDTSVILVEQTDNTVNQNSTIVDLFDYTNTTTWKTGMVLGIANSHTTPTQFLTTRSHILYNQTSAISSLSFFLDDGNFNAGTLLLYGVK